MYEVIGSYFKSFMQIEGLLMTNNRHRAHIYLTKTSKTVQNKVAEPQGSVFLCFI